MKFKWTISLVVLIILIAFGYFYISGQQPEVSALGQASLKAMPDKVSIYVGIDSRNETAQDAQTNNDLIYSKFESALIALGIDKKDIQTSSMNVNPDYDYRIGKQKGFIASRQVVIETSNFSFVGKIVDVAVVSGASATGINFELSQAKQNEYKVDALKQAGQDAQKKAEAVASGLGKKLGRITSIESQEFNYYPYPLYAKAGVSMAEDNAAAQRVAANVQPTDIDVSASVNVKYRTSLF